MKDLNQYLFPQPKEDFHFYETVTASSLYAISAYESFHGNALLLDSRETSVKILSLYMYTSNHHDVHFKYPFYLSVIVQ